MTKTDDIKMALREDAEILGEFYKALKQEGLSAPIAGHIVADFYKRMQLQEQES